MTPASPRTLSMRPFRAVRYAVDAAPDLSTVIAPPYDVIDEEQRLALEARDPHNVVRVILPREPAPEDGFTDRYTGAAALIESWLSAGVLAVDDAPALYVYQQRREGPEGVVLLRGIFGAVGWLPLDAGVILPHENVRSGPVEDRLALMRAMQGNPEPIFLLYDGGGEATKISADVACTPPLRSTQAADGVTHELWAITSPSDLTAIDADLASRSAMIADGHHRYTTYGYLRNEFHDAGAGAGPWDAGLALLVDDSVATPDIRAIHRAIPGLKLTDAIERAAADFTVQAMPAAADVDQALAELARVEGPAFLISDGTTFVMLSSPDAANLAAARPAGRTPAWWDLDASIASVFLMERLWGVTDAAGQVEAEHDPVAALALARSCNGIALMLKPAPLAGIMAVAAAGDAMPRKSTLFLPKPSSGVVLRLFRFEHASGSQ
jgi:uncharacterized protein (DUF1015 family)